MDVTGFGQGHNKLVDRGTGSGRTSFARSAAGVTLPARMSPGASELLVPEELDGRAVLTLLAERLTLEIDRATTSDRVLLDTFDARLREAGLRAEWPAGRASRRRLTLREPGCLRGRRTSRPAPRSPSGRSAWAGAGSAGAGDRGACPRAGRPCRSRVLRAAVLNGDDKTVVRLAVDIPSSTATSCPGAPPVEPVRGYERDFDRVVGRLRDGLGLAPADVPLFDVASPPRGGRPEGAQSKPVFELARGTVSDVAAGVVLLPLSEIAGANVQGVPTT